MNLPTDLQHDVAQRAVQPGFEAVLDRAGASRRRRRTTIASGLAAAVVVGGLAALTGGLAGDDHRSPEPAAPVSTTPWDGTSAPDTRLPSDVVAVLDDQRLQLSSITGGPGGAVAAVWEGCDTDPCRYVLVTRDGDEVVGATFGQAAPDVISVPGGWLVEDARGISRISPSGERSAVIDTGPGDGDVMAGDTAVPTADGWRLLRGDKLIPMPRSPYGTVSAGHVTPDGQLFAAYYGPNGTHGLATLRTDGSWSRSSDVAEAWGTQGTARTPMLAATGSHVALAVLAGDLDGTFPVLSVQVSHDAGLTFTSARGVDAGDGVRLTNLPFLAVASDGTAWLTTGTARVIRIDVDGNARPVNMSSPASGFLAVGGGVCAVTEHGRYDALACSTDGLTGWADQPLPGLG